MADHKYDKLEVQWEGVHSFIHIYNKTHVLLLTITILKTDGYGPTLCRLHIPTQIKKKLRWEL